MKGGIENDHDGYKGSGYANSTNETGAAISWSVNVIQSGTYVLMWRYGLESGSRGANLAINNAGATAVSFDATGAWESWQTTSVEVALDQGNVVIELSSQTAEGLANIDSLTVTGLEVGEGSCDADTDEGTDTETDWDEDAIGPRACGKCSEPLGEYSELIKNTIVVGGGETFDGDCLIYRADPSRLGDGNQDEDQKPVFQLENNATLKNVFLGASAADG